jgi:hypothetical protein
MVMVTVMVMAMVVVMVMVAVLARWDDHVAWGPIATGGAHCWTAWACVECACSIRRLR